VGSEREEGTENMLEKTGRKLHKFVRKTLVSTLKAHQTPKRIKSKRPAHHNQAVKKTKSKKILKTASEKQLIMYSCFLLKKQGKEQVKLKRNPNKMLRLE
jgi:hypothetical protein